MENEVKKQYDEEGREMILNSEFKNKMPYEEYLENYTINGFVSINSFNIIFGFYNCCFLDFVEIKNSKYEGFLSFENNIFKDFWMSDIIFKGNDKYPALEFRECRFEGSVNFNKTIVDTTIFFHDCTFEGPISFDDCFADSIIFNNTQFDHELFIKGSTVQKVVVFENYTELKGTISFQHSDLKLLLLKNSRFRSTIEIDCCDLNIAANSSELTKGMEINCQVIGDVYTKLHQLNLELAGNRIQGAINVIGEHYELSYVGLWFMDSQSGAINFYDCKIPQLEIGGTNRGTNLLFESCELQEVSLDKFNNEANFHFSNCEKLNVERKNQLHLTQSNLGPFHLHQFDFGIFDKIIISKTYLKDIVPSNVDWFKEEQLYIEPAVDGEPEKPWKQRYRDSSKERREIYRQLKQACESNGDRISALEFKRRELKAYQNQKIRKKKFKDYANAVNLCILSTNDHGLNWWKPILWLLGFTFLLYPFIIIGASPAISYVWDWSEEGWNLFRGQMWDHIQILPQLINPARNLNRMFDGDSPGFMGHFFSELHRIFLLFFIFQIVSAFRKYVK